jgi:MarR family transcriptional regulator, transcriptional regulator for hemolysin
MCSSRLGPRCRKKLRAAAIRSITGHTIQQELGERNRNATYTYYSTARSFPVEPACRFQPQSVHLTRWLALRTVRVANESISSAALPNRLTRMKPSRKTPRRTSATERATQPLAGPAPSASTRAALDAQTRSSTADLLAATGETVEGELQQNRRLPILLRRAWYGLNQAFRRRIAHTGLTPDQFTVLRNLTEGDSRGMTQSKLTDLMSSDPNTIAALIDRMETAGHVERRPHERDRRSHRIRLRPKGRSRYRQLVAIAVGLQNDVLAVLPAQRRAAFLRELTCVADGCRTMAEDERRRPETG